MNYSYALDLHVHTRYSHDSSTPVGELLKLSRRRGLSGISISDHCSIEGALKAVQRTKHDESFLVIPSIEIGTQYGDVIVMFVKENIKTRDFHEIVDIAKEEDLPLLLPHPNRIEVARKIGEHMDAIEVVNGGNRITQNLRACLLREELQKTGTAGSDAHQIQNVGRCTTRFASLDEEKIRKALRTNDTRVTGMLYTTINIFRWVRRKVLDTPYQHP